MKFEEVLPAFKKGKKIRRKEWFADHFIYREGHSVYNEDGVDYDFISSDQLLYDDWEIIEEPEPDWEHIIKHKCLCWFWDDDDEDVTLIKYLTSHEKNKRYPFVGYSKGDGHCPYKHCRPVRRDEATFYEDRKNEDS